MIELTKEAVQEHMLNAAKEKSKNTLTPTLSELVTLTGDAARILRQGGFTMISDRLDDLWLNETEKIVNELAFHKHAKGGWTDA